MKPLSEFGCGDSGCIFGPPRGMATNGGCRCFLNPDRGGRDPQEARIRYRAAICEARKYEKAYLEMLKLLERALICLDDVQGNSATILLKDINRRLIINDI